MPQCAVRFARIQRFTKNNRNVVIGPHQDRTMQIFTANQAKTRFGEFIDRAQREPVRVMRHERVVGVVVSAQDFDAVHAFYADRLRTN